MSSHGHAPISGRYALYKEGGNRITRWLVSTASSCRRSLTAKSTAKGKMSTKELLKYAEVITSWKPPIEIPANIIELLEDVILGREVCAEFYRSQDMACRGHQHMIEVLQKILAVLVEARRNRKKERIKDKQKHVAPERVRQIHQKSEEALSNLFENLQIEEPCHEAWDVAPKKKAVQPTAPIAKLTLEVDEKEEKFFALFCFLKDMQEMRSFVMETWQEHADKKLAVVTATMVTETALGIMSRANENLVESYPDFAEIKGILTFLGLQFRADPDGKPGIHCSNAQQGLAVDNELVQMLCPEAAVLVDQLQTLFHDARMRAKDRRAHGASTKEQWRYHEEATPPKAFSFSPFGSLLYRLFPDIFREVMEHKSCKGIPHEFLRGLVEVGYKKKSCMWFISAMQIYSDVHELAQDASAAFYQYCMMHARYVRTMTDFHNYHPNREAQRTALCPHAIKQLRERHGKAVSGNTCAAAYDVYAYKETLMADANWVPARLWRSLPAWSGYQIDEELISMSGSGNHIANDAAIILVTAYLYKACRHAGLLLQSWKDMDWFLEHVGQERPFIQDVGPEGNMATFVRRVYLGIGVSAATFSHDDGRYWTRDHRSSRQTFEQRRIFRTGSDYLRLADELGREDFDDGHPHPWYIQTTLQKVMSKRLQEKSGRSQKQSQRQVEFTGLQLLTFFKQQRIEDEPGLHFNLVAFFMDCIRLLWDLRVQWKGDRAASQPQWDYQLVADVLHDGNEAEIDGKPLASSAMGDAASILEKYIAKQGGRHTNEAFTLARGEIPAAWSEDASTLARGEVPAKWMAINDSMKAKQAGGDPDRVNSNSNSTTHEVDAAAPKYDHPNTRRACCKGKVANGSGYQAQVQDVAEGEELPTL